MSKLPMTAMLLFCYPPPQKKKEEERAKEGKTNDAKLSKKLQVFKISIAVQICRVLQNI